MANRWLQQFRYSHEKQLVDVFASLKCSTTGAFTLDTANSKGVLSVTRTATGSFTFVFGSSPNGFTQLDPYNRLMAIDLTQDTSVPSGSAPIPTTPYVSGNFISVPASASLKVNVVDQTGTLQDFASGTVVTFGFVFKNSSAP